MANAYLEYNFSVKPLIPGSEILIAQLGEIGFESFVETEEGVMAYIQPSDFNAEALESLQILSSEEFEVTYTSELIEQLNWNEEWEKNFTPIEVSHSCVVRAPFHEERQLPYEIVIEPKMSFGTGHHETTFMMLEFLLQNEFKDKKVLDMGCGTAVLAILAEMRGAKAIDAIDIDEWCVENSMENAERNNCENISVSQGDASVLGNKPVYDTIIANINRNILLEDLEIYVQTLTISGELYLSGFYSEDLAQISEVCNNLGLRYVEHKMKNNWVAAKFVN